jgi:pimeloyl-ACP methyl ester carboxylesterase
VDQAFTEPARNGSSGELKPASDYREEWLPQAEWIVLDGVGHYPQLDVPLQTAQLILGFASPVR